MTIFTIYDPTTGNIIRTGAVQNDSDSGLQPKTGEAILTGARGDLSSQKVTVVNGVASLASK
jgi:hypothetical protein